MTAEGKISAVFLFIQQKPDLVRLACCVEIFFLKYISTYVDMSIISHYF